MDDPFKPLIDPAWRRLGPEPDFDAAYPVMWAYQVSPPFPSRWPPGPGLVLHYYVYAYGISPGLSDGVYQAAPWARVEADPRSEKAPMLEILAKKIRELGIQGVRPLDEAEVAVAELGEAVETYLEALEALPDESQPAARDLRRYYDQWLELNPALRDEIRPNHQQFFLWLSGGENSP